MTKWLLLLTVAVVDPVLREIIRALSLPLWWNGLPFVLVLWVGMWIGDKGEAPWRDSK